MNTTIRRISVCIERGIAGQDVQETLEVDIAGMTPEEADAACDEVAHDAFHNVCSYGWSLAE